MSLTCHSEHAVCLLFPSTYSIGKERIVKGERGRFMFSIMVLSKPLS